MTLSEVIMYWKGAHRAIKQPITDEVAKEWIQKMEDKLRDGGVPQHLIAESLIDVLKTQADNLSTLVYGDEKTKKDVANNMVFKKINEL